MPAWLLSRRPATEALASATGGGRRRPSRLAHLARSARLPLPAVLGVGDAFARRPRALLAILALALSISALVAALGMEVDLRRDQATEPLQELMTTAYDGGEPFDAITDAGAQAERLRGVVYPGVAVLLLLGLGNLVAVLALALREGRHDTSILRAVGLTPRDTAWMVVWRQLALSLVAVALGIPLGLGIWWLGSQMGGAQDDQLSVTAAAARRRRRRGDRLHARHGAAGADDVTAARDRRPASGVRLPGVPAVDLDPGAVARAVAVGVRLAAVVL